MTIQALFRICAFFIFLSITLRTLSNAYETEFSLQKPLRAIGKAYTLLAVLVPSILLLDMISGGLSLQEATGGPGMITFVFTSMAIWLVFNPSKYRRRA